MTLKERTHEEALIDALLKDEINDQEIEDLIASSPESHVLVDGMTTLMAFLMSDYLQKCSDTAIGMIIAKNKNIIDARNAFGETALLIAASNETQRGAEVIKNIVLARARIDVKDHMGWGILSNVALHSPDPSLLDYCIEKGSAVDEVSKLKVTPLMAACARSDDREDFAKKLFDRGADPKAVTSDGKTALDIAKEYGNSNIEAYILKILEIEPIVHPVEPSVNIAELIQAVRNVIADTIALVRPLAPIGLQFGGGNLGGNEPAQVIREEDIAHETPKIRNGVTPLMIAALEGSADLKGLITQKDTDLNARDERGLTALHYALCGGRLRSVMALLDAGADINAVDNDGRNALIYALLSDIGYKPQVVKLLLERGANPKGVMESMPEDLIDEECKLILRQWKPAQYRS
ncbi:hypothetical protein AGMMS50276_25330 [Synergistales bacterium]|nr:hypothetical protein AGMMS50276_25330 [Synergistales bacterium]